MPREDILSLLRDPREFAAQSVRPQLWRGALDKVVLPAIAKKAKARPLREAQIEAWRALEDQRLGLILGPPGTGKTFTLSWMALAYLESHRRAGLPCRVMVTAFTRAAIANVLEAIADKARQVLGVELPVHFLGNAPTTSSAIECLDLEQFGAVLGADQVVLGCTTWGLCRALERGWHGGPKGSHDASLFDLVCIDEASQLQVPLALMGLAGLAEEGRVLIAGDNRQLAPIGGGYEWAVDNRELGSSVYDFLVAAGVPEHRLSETFRLNRPLSVFPARAFYSRNYDSALEIAERKLELIESWSRGLEPWLRVALNPEYPVVVLLYDGPPAGTRNLAEVGLVRQLVEALWTRVTPWHGAPVTRSEEFWAEQLAVISPHRAQNVAIRGALSPLACGRDCVVETVERIQGRERDTIVASYTVSDPEFALAEAGFLFSPQRFNVSLTRARSKFVLIVSRALLEVIPSDDELFDAARLLREFVFECSKAGSVQLEPEPGRGLRVEVMVRGFDEHSKLPEDLLEPTPETAEVAPLAPPMTPALVDLLEALRRERAAQQARNTHYRHVTDYRLAQLLGRDVSFAELRALQLNGHIELQQRTRRSGSGQFWVAAPIEPQLDILACERESVRREIERVVLDIQSSGQGPRYDRVKNRFAWVDAQGRDQLRPLLDELEGQGKLRFELSRWGKELIRIEASELCQTPRPAPAEPLTDEDFALLNTLEDLEVQRINFGVFEGWSSALELSRSTGRNRHEVASAVQRLELHGYLMRTEDEVPRVRSRMAEVGRELRYVKQRFRTDDANTRPYLVRSLKVIARNREKPLRDRPLAEVFAALRQRLVSVPHAPDVLDGIHSMLRARWGEGAAISGFQERSWLALIPAWLGLEPTTTAVITADTGAGKTEAACLPLIVGAAIDVLGGTRGTRAVLVYPRIRLAANQAQRLTSYLRALAQIEGMPQLTIGLQTGDVPTSWGVARRLVERAERDPRERTPAWLPERAGWWRFPFFACPSCEGELLVRETGEPVDELLCRDEQDCGWGFVGWVGTKTGLIASPPHVFLPVTESLHQWMQQPKYGVIFGDDADRPGAPSAPRAILADEIHLYSLVAGAQVGYALRRLLVRMRANGTAAPLAIGMSATLGDPTRVWSELVGRPRVDVLHVGPHEHEREDNVRGREYFYFVQPEVESRGQDIAGASTSIQALMCLAHGMRRRTGSEGGFRGIMFLDSIDKLKRLHGNYADAEQNGRLARLRTLHHGNAERCVSDTERCGRDPRNCDRFRDGECWYFGATDGAQWTARGLYEPGRNLAVCRSPVFSGTRGNADEIVRQSDLVFATSSLEVGFDDPDMTLVYQHYAPVNLASFIQRKGRGGRGSDDRPTTGVTLSVYSPRDSWYFRAPERMLDAANFEVPLNTDNYFVRRGQVLSLVLDWVARWQRREHVELDAQRDLSAVFAAVEPALVEVFDRGIYQELEVESLAQLWAQALRVLRPGERLPIGSPLDWGKRLPQVPSRLFDPINLPLLTVRYEPERGPARDKEEDVTLAFTECAPGKATRRWGHELVHWNPYRGERAPLFSGTDETSFERFSLGQSLVDPEQTNRLLPLEARELLRHPPEAEIVRPLRLEPEVLGRLRGRSWDPNWEFDVNQRIVQRRREPNNDDGPRHPTIHHQTTGRLLGTVLAVHEPEHAVRIPIDALAGLSEAGELAYYRCHRRHGQRTGLRITHAFWGADISLVLETQRGQVAMRSRDYLRQVFTHSRDPNRPILFGYGMDSEGVCLELDSALLDRFVDNEFTRLDEAPDDMNWMRAQFFRYVLASRASGAGVTTYQARQLAELIVSAAAIPRLRDALGRCVDTWSWTRFRSLMQETHTQLLSQDPVLTNTRIAATLDGLEGALPNFQRFLREAISTVNDDRQFRAWLRSAVLHGLLLRLRQIFVLHGRGDERKILIHAMLPLQFGEDGNDRLTVCEKGSFGDGTTRTFLQHAERAFSAWREEGVVACPNAIADQAVDRAFDQDEHHALWRSWDPGDPSTPARLARALGCDPKADVDAILLVLRLLHGYEELYGQRLDYYDLYREIRAVRAELRNPEGEMRMLREPGTWELVGAVVRAADTNGPLTPNWSRLLDIYGRIEDSAIEGSLAPQARLAEQVHRLSARLCPDGCQACLHVGSDLMDDGLAAVTVSRGLLQRYWALVETREVPRSPRSRATAPGVDYRWHASDWDSMFAALTQIHGIALTPGRDVLGPNQRVVGTTLAELSSGARRLHLVDGRSDWSAATLMALQVAGEPALRLDPHEGVGPILAHLEEP